MIRRLATLAAASLAALALLPAGSQAAPAAPAFKLILTPQPTTFNPGADIQDEILAYATNVGAEQTSGPVTVEVTLPAGVSATAATGESCTVAPETVICSFSETVFPGEGTGMDVALEVDPLAGGGPLQAEAKVSGGGAAEAVASAPIVRSAETPPFDFLPGAEGFAAALTEADGLPAAQAGSHPNQLTVDLGFNSRLSGNVSGSGTIIGADGGLRSLTTFLPRGLTVNPSATPLRCTEAQLELTACPDASQIGTVDVLTVPLAQVTPYQSALYNMVPPSGAPASLGFDAIGVGIYVHIIGGLRAGDYTISAHTDDILARFANPVLGARVQLWGDSSSPSHDHNRGTCSFPITPAGEACPVTPGETPLLTAPTACPGHPGLFEALADSWGHPGLLKSASAEVSDLEGNPVGSSGCNAIEYQPTFSARPTTDLADSPSGLEVDLHQPQEQPHPEPLTGRATAQLRDATVTLPQGLVANPSQAGGLAACSESQIGYLPEDQEPGIQPGIHFSEKPQSCPDAAKLGSLEVTSPLLAEYSPDGAELRADPETHAPIARPLHGSVYLATPFQNPFGSFLAIYLAVEDEESGIVAKLAGKVIPDPQTGQLTTVFEENPQLPLEDVKLEFFKGARASLTTPPSCGAHTTTTTLVPWSSPEGADAHPESSFQTTAEPGGGSCPASEGAAANAPALSAGTISPHAGAYSPFVLKLSRNDGSQRLAGLDTTLPPGLTGKLAGIAECSDAQIAQAKAREHPNDGILEREHPSCPAASEVGTVDVAAGSGPTPFHTSGHAYLAGPYKGAPLSLAVIVPAVAGPFDLGAVLTRVALHLDPASAQIHAVSDPFPQILDGIPLDLRQVSLTMGRPDFTLNPTSCDPMSLTGSATSSLGSVAALANHFQVGGCSSLKFKPHMTLKLKGGTKRTAHPKLIATVYSQGAGVANLARVQVKLPSSAFLDQAHIRTICTRVQFAAGAGNGAECPKGSIYGEAQVKTPLFDYTLPGKVLLRSSNHKLPDLIIALQGPANQPIAVELDGKTDSIHGALRNTFEAVPDQPFTQARVVLFGGKRGLVVNSRNLCSQSKRASRANVQLNAQSGKVSQLHPLVRNSCKKARHKRHRKHRKGESQRHKGK